ncbi:hypothetical protein NDU88_005067 [Pleurodeles waltl]|uniref:Uncharacterized protein n=1 Tax=Pleurodeles waltl TaxID=8319 RepID=A0AAV7NLE7_PLEWA|nr:hypothetical protein NDU88_005067 [Pleurodeles waltl]
MQVSHNIGPRLPELGRKPERPNTRLPWAFHLLPSLHRRSHRCMWGRVKTKEAASPGLGDEQTGPTVRRVTPFPGSVGVYHLDYGAPAATCHVGECMSRVCTQVY